MPKTLRSESGEMLIEMLITITLIGVGLVSIVSIMGSSILMSDVHRTMAEGEVVARAYADEILAKASEPVAESAFDPCPEAADLEPAPFASPIDHSGWVADITEVEYWIRGGDPLTLPNGSFQGGAAGLAACVARCPTITCAPGLDSGLLRVTITAENSRSGAQKREVESKILIRRSNPT